MSLTITLTHISLCITRRTNEGNFGREQKEDDRLVQCWGQVLQMEGENQQGDQVLPTSYMSSYW